MNLWFKVDSHNGIVGHPTLKLSPVNQDLRQQFHHRRNSVPSKSRYFHALRASQHLAQWPQLSQFKHSACYLSVKGELPTLPLIDVLWKSGQRVYLPLLHQSGHPKLHFLPYTPASPLKNNRFGIPEPIYHPRLERSAKQLDLVLMPLLAFDELGSRLGMGGGFYDRSFSFINDQQPTKKRPFLLGVAMHCQKAHRLERRPWDVPLDGVLTERGLLLFKRAS